jgi:hypothetical protein
MTIEYHPAGEQELQAIRDYYESRLPGLGREFIDEFERQVLRIAAAPERWTILQRDVRRALMKRFPFVIYFRQTAPSYCGEASAPTPAVRKTTQVGC